MRFKISVHPNQYYQVSIPNYEGGEVVTLDEVQQIEERWREEQGHASRIWQAAMVKDRELLEASNQLAAVTAERDRCHELIDEFFEHPRKPAEPLDVKVGRLLIDAETLLKERDEARAELARLKGEE